MVHVKQLNYERVQTQGISKCSLFENRDFTLNADMSIRKGKKSQIGRHIARVLESEL